MTEFMTELLFTPVDDLIKYLECNYKADEEKLASKLIPAFVRVAYVFLALGTLLGILVSAAIVVGYYLVTAWFV